MCFSVCLIAACRKRQTCRTFAHCCVITEKQRESVQFYISHLSYAYSHVVVVFVVCLFVVVVVFFGGWLLDVLRGL